jgi:hypothetical protein
LIYFLYLDINKKLQGMTRLETLTAIRESNYDASERLDSIRKYLSIRETRAKRDLVASIITPLFDNDRVTFRNDSIEIYFNEDSRYSDLRVYLNTKWSDGKDEYKTEYEINTASFNGVGDTTKDNEWMVTRFKKIASYTELVVDHIEDVIAGLDNIKSKYFLMYESMYAMTKPYTKNARKASELINELERQATLRDLSTVGVTFKQPENWDRYGSPEIELKFNWTVKGIKKIKVSNVTASGKSADVEIYTNYYGAKDYDGRDVKPLVEKRVRMGNILALVSQYKSWINA